MYMYMFKAIHELKKDYSSQKHTYIIFTHLNPTFI